MGRGARGAPLRPHGPPWQIAKRSQKKIYEESPKYQPNPHYQPKKRRYLNTRGRYGALVTDSGHINQLLHDQSCSNHEAKKERPPEV